MRAYFIMLVNDKMAVAATLEICELKIKKIKKANKATIVYLELSINKGKREITSPMLHVP